jgi:hypothetical protein
MRMRMRRRRRRRRRRRECFRVQSKGPKSRLTDEKRRRSTPMCVLGFPLLV